MGLALSLKTVSSEVDLDVLSEETSELSNELLAVLMMLISLGFIIFTLQMLAFQVYLISVGLTTWEYLSWMKITYLKVWPKRYGSPFSHGCCHNWQMFCCHSFRKHERCHQWIMPRELPKLE